MKLHDILYSKGGMSGKSLYDLIKRNFASYPLFLRGTCLTLQEFNENYGFDFSQSSSNINVENLVDLAEYLYNMIVYLNDEYSSINKSLIFQHINLLIEKISYISTDDEGFTIFVPRDSCAISVAESDLIPQDISYKLLAYNHSSRKGNLEEKKSVLIKLAELLEPQKKELESINKSFSSDIFQLFNKCNIRHNNINQNDLGKFNSYIANASSEELEEIYDNIYQMCLLAFMQLEHKNRNSWLSEIKTNLSKN